MLELGLLLSYEKKGNFFSCKEYVKQAEKPSIKNGK